MKNKRKIFCVLLTISILISTLLTGCGISDVENAIDTLDKINDALTIDISTDDEMSDNSGNSVDAVVDYHFRYDDLLQSHYEKHGIEMGFDSKESYEAAASAVINNPSALHKKEAEDNDEVYYVEATNEFVILSQDGYIRTYFYPSAGRKYYDRQ